MTKLNSVLKLNSDFYLEVSAHFHTFFTNLLPGMNQAMHLLISGEVDFNLKGVYDMPEARIAKLEALNKGKYLIETVDLSLRDMAAVSTHSPP